MPFRLFDEARYSECLRSIEDDQSPESLLLRMRVLLRLGRHLDIVRGVTLSHIADIPIERRGLAYSMLAVARRRCRVEQSYELMEDALNLAAHSDSDTVDEITFFRISFALASNDLALAEDLCRFLSCREQWRSRSLILRAQIAFQRCEMQTNLALLQDALLAVPESDVWHRVIVLVSLLYVAKELMDEDAILNAEIALLSVSGWTADLAVQKFKAFHNLGWCDMLRGRFLQAYSRFCIARDAAPQPTYKTLAFTNLAFLATAWYQWETMALHLKDATVAAVSADWKNAGEEKTALLSLAELWAEYDPNYAATWIARYCDGIPASPYRLIHDSEDPRRRATEQFSAGVVYRRLGMCDEATTALTSAKEAAESLGYHWRACLAALELSYVTGSDKWRHGAIPIIDAVAPESWIARSLDRDRRRFLLHPDVLVLSPGKREVLHLLFDGLKNEDIAVRMHVSLPVVKKRVSEILSHFGARSHRELVHILLDRGII